MSAPIDSDRVWREVERARFAVLGTATASGEPRTAGIVYAVRDRQIYIGTDRTSWKVRHIERSPAVSLTVAIPRRVPFLPWIRIPAATISFQGEATLRDLSDVPQDLPGELFRGLEVDPDRMRDVCFIEVRPKGRFLTYGIGVSISAMRHPEEARGRVRV